MGFRFREFEIPDDMMPGLEAYCRDGIVPGHFLEAVISNDLHEAVGRADTQNLHCIPAYVAYLYNRADPRCWGSPEKMRDWIEAKQEERRQLERADR